MDAAAGTATFLFLAVAVYLAFGLWLANWQPKCKKCNGPCEFTGPHGCFIVCSGCGQDQAGL